MPPTSPKPDPAHPDLETVLEARRTEQRRIAQLLHDTVSQSLTGAQMQAKVLAQQMERNGFVDAGDVGRLTKMLHQAVLELRAVTRELQGAEGEPSEALSPSGSGAAGRPATTTTRRAGTDRKPTPS